MQLTSTRAVPEFPRTEGLSHDQRSMGSESSMAIVKERGPVVADEGYPHQTVVSGSYDRLLPGVVDMRYTVVHAQGFQRLEICPSHQGG